MLVSPKIGYTTPNVYFNRDNDDGYVNAVGVSPTKLSETIGRTIQYHIIPTGDLWNPRLIELDDGKIYRKALYSLNQSSDSLETNPSGSDLALKAQTLETKQILVPTDEVWHHTVDFRSKNSLGNVDSHEKYGSGKWKTLQWTQKMANKKWSENRK